MPGQAFRAACALLRRAGLLSTLLNSKQQFPKSVGLVSRIHLGKFLWKALVNWGPFKRTWKWLDKPSVSKFTIRFFFSFFTAKWECNSYGLPTDVRADTRHYPSKPHGDLQCTILFSWILSKASQAWSQNISSNDKSPQSCFSSLFKCENSIHLW